MLAGIGIETAAAAELVDASSAACGGSRSGPVAGALDLLATAQRHTTEWDGPKTGPALPDKLAVYVAQDMRNGGVLGVSEGAERDCRDRLESEDHRREGSVAGRVTAINQAVALKPDGIILGSVMH
jgi:ribose transport system substrate-binding protein